MNFPEDKSLRLEEIQQVSFDILRTIKKICEHEDLHYALAFGTLLGAVRHQGYIPWDDDVDIIMPRPDFEKLSRYFESHRDELMPYALWNRSKNRDYPYTMSRIIDTRYVLDVKNEKPCGMGVFVDIYVLDGAGNSLEEAHELLKKTKFYPSCIFLATRKSLRQDMTKGWRSFVKPLFYAYVKALGRDFFEKRLYKIIGRYDYASCSHLACLEWDNTTGSATAKEDIENPVPILFNGEYFNAPRNYDLYLKRNYGDYMTPPPEKDRVYHHLYKAYRKADIG